MRTALIMIALILASACTPTGYTPLYRAEVAAGCTGGFTGGGQGVTITSRDHIVRWRQLTAGAQRTETDLGEDSAFAAEVRLRLHSIGFARIQFSETGNMTCTLRRGDHVVSWQQGDTRAPAEVVAIHELVLTAGGRE